MPERERFRIDVEALPWSAPAIYRLRKCLKIFGRWYGMKCTGVVEVKPDGERDRTAEVDAPDAHPECDRNLCDGAQIEVRTD
jgi:hypothetical protein